MQRFVSLALDETNNELVFCQNVDQALAALTEQRFDFILTDLMLPGESGLSFIRRLAADEKIAQGAEVVALSAGIDAAIMTELETLGVRKKLLKPVSVSTLQAIFLNNFTDLDAEAKADNQKTIDRYFGGQHELFNQFKEQSFPLLANDIEKGDLLLIARDLAALHQLAHSLKSVLVLLGQEHLHARALELERYLVHAPDLNEVARQWQALRTGLGKLLGNSDYTRRSH